MKIKILIVAALSVFVLTGCATLRRGQNTPQNASLQTKVANLEQQMSARDQEISDLRYDLDRLSDHMAASRDDASYRRVEYVPASDVGYSAVSAPKTVDDGEIIRVPVSVQAVQKALKNAGYYAGNIDGKVGEKTKAAIRDFQKYHDLKVDGIVGKATWAALKSYSE